MCIQLSLARYPAHNNGELLKNNFVERTIPTIGQLKYHHLSIEQETSHDIVNVLRTTR